MMLFDNRPLWERTQEEVDAAHEYYDKHRAEMPEFDQELYLENLKNGINYCPNFFELVLNHRVRSFEKKMNEEYRSEIYTYEIEILEWKEKPISYRLMHLGLRPIKPVKPFSKHWERYKKRRDKRREKLNADST